MRFAESILLTSVACDACVICIRFRSCAVLKEVSRLCGLLYPFVRSGIAVFVRTEASGAGTPLQESGVFAVVSRCALFGA